MVTKKVLIHFFRRQFLILLMFFLAVGFASAQESTVTGTVSSADEGPLVGVNIAVQGSTTGAVSDINGQYTIKVPGPDAVLVFTFVGYGTQTITVGSQSVIDVVLVATENALNEVVVVGYGTQKRNEITSSVSNVKSDDFTKGYVNAPEQLIQGKVAGLSITRAGGDLNQGYNIRLRGLSTIGANTQPLIVIDGIIGGSLENVDPNDIESMNVLKDGSAAAIYGSRASSGVILVTTKKGAKGTTTVEYNGYGTVEMIAKTVPVMNAEEWRQLSDETGLGEDFGASTDWFDETTQNAYTLVQNISLSGGTKNSTYRASFNYRNADGVQINTGFSQLNGRVNFTQKALKDKLTLDVNLGATSKKAQYGFADAFRYATIYNPTAPVRSDDVEYEQYDGYFQQVLYDYYNPVSIIELNKNDGTDKLMELSLKGTYEIFKGLMIDAFYSHQSFSFFRGRYYDKNSYFVGMGRNGLANRSTYNSASQLFETTARWSGNLASSVNLSVLGGYSYQEFVNEGFTAEGGDFLTDAFTYNNLGAALDFKNGIGTVTSYKNSNKLIAFFGRVNLNVNNIYFLNASARYEGSSKFGANHKWGLFPAVSGGVELGKLINVDVINNLKLRASYGVTGNQPEDSYLSLLRFGPSGNFYYNGEFGPAYAPVSNANEDLKWETKTEIDFGFDFAILNSTLSGSFDFYTRTSNDILFPYEVPVPPNLYTQALLNLGEIKSSGLELTLNWSVLKKGDLKYDITLTPSYNIENTLVSLSGNYNGAELTYGQQDLGGMGAPGQSDVPLVRAEEGGPIGQLLALEYKGIDTDGNLTFVDQNNDTVINTLDRIIVGNGLPKFQIGFANTFTYKQFDLNISFRGVFGHDLLNSYRGFYEVPNAISSYNLPKTAMDLRNPETGALMNSNSGVLSSYHIENADFVSLDNLSLGYSFNLKNKEYFNKIRLYIAGNNLFYITGYKGVDPNPRYGDIEDNNNPLVPGIDRRNTWFRTRAISFGANIVF
ncbi:MAG: SusC/RagA family TonB-linked outer membrane protein [Bacteroidales bacterium]